MERYSRREKTEAGMGATRGTEYPARLGVIRDVRVFWSISANATLNCGRELPFDPCC